MINLAVNGYTKEEVIKQLHYANGSRETYFSLDLLNRFDVKIGELEALPTGSIRFDSLAEIKRMANLTLKESQFRDIDWLNDRVRPVFHLKMKDGGYASWNMGVFLISSPTRRDGGSYIVRELELYDKTTILREDKVDKRHLIRTGTKYIDAITSIINSAGIHQVSLTPSNLTINIDKEYEIGTPKIQIINELLEEMNYTQIWVDENGMFTASPYVIPSQRDTEYTYRDNELSIIHPDSVEELDVFATPNKWVRTLSNPEVKPITSKYENNSLSSLTSIPNRGRMIVDVDKVDDIADQATLDAYTKRIAYEASQIYGKFIFKTAIMPHHSYMDLLFIDHQRMGVSAKFTETNWRINLDGGMEHSCRRVVFI